MTTPHDPAAIELSIGDTIMRDGHELMWDSGQWVHSPDCRHEQVDPAAIRARLHLTLDEMAARMFVNRATVWRWEHGAKPRPYHMRQLVKLAQEETR